MQPQHRADKSHYRQSGFEIWLEYLIKQMKKQIGKEDIEGEAWYVISDSTIDYLDGPWECRTFWGTETMIARFATEQKVKLCVDAVG